MQVRHLVARDNLTPDGRIVDPTAVRHGALRAGRVHALAGPIDAETHLNLDFPDHRLDPCVVVEALSEGAPVIFDAADLARPARDEPLPDDAPLTLPPFPDTDTGPDSPYLLATTVPTAYAHRGPVDVGARRTAWLTALRERRAARHPSRPQPTTH
jgi:hypothetical protein